MWIKICGVTTRDDASMIVEAGADAIGLNFFSQSKRYVAPQRAQSLRAGIGDALNVVGVFVNSPIEEVVDIASTVKLDTVQFHGDETPAQIAEFHQRCPATNIVRAFRIGTAGLLQMKQALAELEAAAVPLMAVLVDAWVDGEYGGTGRQVAAGLLDDRPDEMPPLILAGGLTPQTVSDAVARIRPWGVDTASGVEISPGVKDAGMVQQFVRKARATGG